MPLAKLRIQPQRRSPRGGWLPCEPHRAQRWALLRNGAQVAAFDRKDLAEGLLARLEAGAKAKTPTKTPGSRYGELGIRGTGRILYSSKKDPSQ